MGQSIWKDKIEIPRCLALLHPQFSEATSRNLSPGFFPTTVLADRQKGILLDGGRGLVLHSCFRLGPRLDLVAGEREVDDHADGAERGRDAEDHVPLLDRALSQK